MTLVSFKHEPLEQYLAASDSVLVRRFDFTLFRRGTFQGWPDGPESPCNENQDFFYRQKEAGLQRNINAILSCCGAGNPWIPKSPFPPDAPSLSSWTRGLPRRVLTCKLLPERCQ